MTRLERESNCAKAFLSLATRASTPTYFTRARGPFTENQRSFPVNQVSRGVESQTTQTSRAPKKPLNLAL